MPPNSGAVVCAARIAPVVRRRTTDVSSCGATRSLKMTEASVYGQPCHLSSSLTPNGTPPKGKRDVGEAAASRALVEVGEAEDVEGRGLDGSDAVVQRFERRQLFGPERVDQAAGVPQPRRAHRRGQYPPPTSPARVASLARR